MRYHLSGILSGYLDGPVRGAVVYGHDLVRSLERASARETAARVAVGAVCKALLGAVGVEVFAHVVSIGSVAASLDGLDLATLRARSAEADLRCADPAAEAEMRDAIHAETGLDTELSTTGGTSDGRFIAKICPQVIELGPVNATIHKINEHVAVASLEPLKNIYKGVLERLAALA